MAAFITPIAVAGLPADFNGDGFVGGWGPCGGCPTNINGDNVVDVNDLLLLVGAWGAGP